MKISEETKLDIPIFFNVGILIGILAAWVYLVFFVNMPWWVKLTSSIGEFSIIGILIFSIIEAIKAKKNYHIMINEMNVPPTGDASMMKSAIEHQMNEIVAQKERETNDG